MMRPWWRWWISVSVGWALVACGGSPTPAYDDPNLLFKDDFAQTTTGWETYSDPDKTANYDNGQYVIAVNLPNINAVWSTPGLDFVDTVLKVDTAYVAGPVDNQFGVMCRYTRHGDNSNSFYFFVISSDGYYGYGKVIKDVFTMLTPDAPYLASSAVLTAPTDINRLSASCVGQTMSFSVNGTALGAFEDTELKHGDIGVLAGAFFDEGGVTIHFDNVEVRRP